MAFYAVNNQMFSTLADLRQQVGTDGINVVMSGMNTSTDGLGGTFRWDAASTAADDGKSVIQVTGVSTGRWIRMLNSNTQKGVISFNTGIGQNSYTVTHNLGIIPVAIFLQTTGPNILTAVYHDKSLDTINTFTIKYNPLAILTTISMDYLIIKF